ncbi:mitogen-activated protein kinase kinase kinase 7-interacting protein 3 homolog isoform X1 [Saccostrea echinata]|uniref:mitogen-activated protein kinase kinase kinase 7-interacting protein 3 homolog isoform X1 n=1 Tax=Saccostrea echinata TaxID=191078 RepID=UPI002A831DBC|nr:mitogen-activated protein kinase kinase kinase 7-interacting protein 3 homolog isoform X1 [Saccostrea echinata]
MATVEPNINVTLFQELKKKYPEIPDYVVTSKMQQHKNDRAKCIEVLDGENDNYLFGPTPPTHTSYQEIQLTPASEGRKRSDSGSSGVSSTSTCSMSSSSSVPYTNPNGGKSYQGYSSEASRPQSFQTGNFDQYVHVQPYRSIPHIPCEDGGRVPMGYNYPQVQNPPTSSPSPLRQIQIHHQGPSVISRPTPTQIEIQISPRVGQQDQYRHNVIGYQRQQNSYGNHTMGRTNTGNINNYSATGFNSLDRQNLKTRRPVPPVPTSHNDSHGAALQFAPPSKQIINSPTNPQQEKHSSQKTIFLQPAPSTPDRTQHTMGDYGMHQSQSDSNLPPTYPPISQPDSVSGGHSNPTIPHRSPLSVNVFDTEVNNPGSPHYNRYLPSDSVPHINGQQYLNIKYGDPVLNIGGAVNPPSYQVYQVSGGASDSDQMFGHPYVMNPGNRCVIPGHPHVYVRTPSSDSDRRSNPTPPIEERHLANPHVMFPPVSIGAVTEPTRVDRSVPQSAGGQEEADYTRALLKFQREKMENLKQDLESELRKLIKTRSEVKQMEKNMLERKKNKSYYNQQPLEDVTRLREINRRLQADIQVMTREIDMYNNGQTPLGVLDPLEQQNFYNNMNTGPQGSIYSRPPPQTPSRETPPPIPPRTPITTPTTALIPPAPPPQPQQDSDGDGEPWNCSACTFLNHPALNKCECCEMPRMNTSPPTTGTVRHVCTSELCYCHNR